jgi:hypothetical protein
VGKKYAKSACTAGRPVKGVRWGKPMNFYSIDLMNVSDETNFFTVFDGNCVYGIRYIAVVFRGWPPPDSPEAKEDDDDED